MNLSLYDEVKAWKRPIHKSKSTLAKTYLKLIPNVDVIAVAGSVGKTLTQNAIYAVLSQKFNTIVGEENLDPTFRIPQTILKTKPWHKYLILEYGIEHPGQMDYYINLATPKYVVMTTVSLEHIKYFQSLENVLEEESKIVKKLPKSSYAILNADDKLSQEIAKETKSTIVWFGSLAKKGVKISHYKQNLHGSTFRLHYRGDVAFVRWKVIGKHQLTSAYAAATIGILTGLTVKQVAKGLSYTKVPVHRLYAKTTEHANIVDDSYNSSPKAAEEAIKTLIELGKGKKKIAVLGEMKDLGVLSEISHEQLGKFIAKTRINYLITVGKKAKTIGLSAKQNGFRGKIIFAKSTKETIKSVKPLVSKKSLVLIKGSRHEHLERVVYGLTHKSTHINCYHCGELK